MDKTRHNVLRPRTSESTRGWPKSVIVLWPRPPYFFVPVKGGFGEEREGTETKNLRRDRRELQQSQDPSGLGTRGKGEVVSHRHRRMMTIRDPVERHGTNRESLWWRTIVVKGRNLKETTFMNFTKTTRTNLGLCVYLNFDTKNV